MQPLRFHGPYALLLNEGMFPGAPGGPWREAYRAICPPSTEPLRVVMAYHYADNDMLAGFAPEVVHANRPRVVSTVDSLRTIAHAFVPGVRLHDAFTQAAQVEGDLPIEACAYIVASAARAVHALHRARRVRVDELTTHRVELGFDGGVLYTGCAGTPPVFELPDAPPALHHDDDFDMLILVIPPFPLPEDRRRAATEDQLTPEEAQHLGHGDARSDVFLLGGMLQLLIEGRHPFARDNLLGTLDAVRRGGAHPLRRDVPRELREVLERALAVSPSARFADAESFADALSSLFDPAAAARFVAGWLASLYPEARREQLEFVEQARMLDITVVNGAPRVLPRLADTPDVDHRGFTTLVRVHSAPRLWIEKRLVTNEQFVRFLDEHGLQDPVGFRGRSPELAHQPAVFVPPALAQRYARWAGRALPSNDEWNHAVRGGGFGRASACGVSDLCRVWEWTSTPMRSGFLVRGGQWRNREDAALVDNRSWEDEGAVDVGFRCAYHAQDDWEPPTS